MSTVVFMLVVHAIIAGQPVDNYYPMGSEDECRMNEMIQNSVFAKDPKNKGWHAKCLVNRQAWTPVR